MSESSRAANPCTRPIRDPSDALARGFSQPFPLFRRWQRDAARSGLFGQANVMVLATACDKTLRTSQRPMQLADVCDNAFLFLTTQQSRKGCLIAKNGRVSVYFDWLAQGRYVSAEGDATVMKDQHLVRRYFHRTFTPELCCYFYAIGSNQSMVIDDEFKDKFQDISSKISGYKEGSIPPPESMALYRVEASSFEFSENSREFGNVRLMYSRLTEATQVDNRYTFCDNPDWVVEQMAQ